MDFSTLVENIEANKEFKLRDLILTLLAEKNTELIEDLILAFTSINGSETELNINLNLINFARKHKLKVLGCLLLNKRVIFQPTDFSIASFEVCGRQEVTFKETQKTYQLSKNKRFGYDWKELGHVDCDTFINNIPEQKTSQMAMAIGKVNLLVNFKT